MVNSSKPLAAATPWARRARLRRGKRMTVNIAGAARVEAGGAALDDVKRDFALTTAQQGFYVFDRSPVSAIF
jgi:hypothetical protein